MGWFFPWFRYSVIGIIDAFLPRPIDKHIQAGDKQLLLLMNLRNIYSIAGNVAELAWLFFGKTWFKFFVRCNPYVSGAMTCIRMLFIYAYDRQKYVERNILNEAAWGLASVALIGLATPSMVAAIEESK